MRLDRLVRLMAALSVVVVMAATGDVVGRHVYADRQGPRDLATARAIASGVTVPDARPSSQCRAGGIECWSTSLSVRVVTRSVDTALRTAGRQTPRVRCLTYRVGLLDPGAQVSSCVVDVRVGAHLAYAYVDPITSGPLTNEHAVGATVSLNAE
jgi:hypothetical protein